MGMKSKYEVELEVTKSYKVTVTVEGNFAGADDPQIAEEAEKVADNMSHDSWSYQDTEFDIQNITEKNDD